MLFSSKTFECDSPDFAIHSIPDNEQFLVRRDILNGSQVFNDMFACCSSGGSTDTPLDQLKIDEKAETLHLLLQLLHSPPPAPIPIHIKNKSEISQIRTRTHESDSMIPWPLLPALLHLADKYMLSQHLVDSLHEHLLAHVPVYPLEVYGFACQHGLDRIASKASKYIPPVAGFSIQEIKVIPTVEAYHRLVQLQDNRVKAMRKILLEEDMFPFNYGICLPHHEEARALWDKARRRLIGRIETDTDVGGEMTYVSESFDSCDACSKACTAAVEMLSYKCSRVTKGIKLKAPPV
ncbi:hypothetical protein BDN71DRAFT_77761 [Pleurotus eryngii]|uniref:BTB domain-containing protein n=1 Tax=Pleurotus eryngii TaxID=5323 RepID=A0A9P6DCP2_PLEER|nr:hypothetical protein BDN71DRAFT_77761 [Pleurotus eryngii]